MPDPQDDAPSDPRRRSQRPTDPSRPRTNCPACLDDAGEPTGDALVQLASGTWVREPCDICGGLKKVDETALVSYLARNRSEQ